MKQGSTLFLRAATAAIGLSVLALCLFALPMGIRQTSIDGYRPIFFGMYVTAIPFFMALYQTFKLLSYIDTNKAFSEISVAALKHIKWCAVIISALYIGGLPYIYVVAEKDDAPGVIAIGLVIIGASWVVAVFAAVLQQLLNNAIAIKSENDLTV